MFRLIGILCFIFCGAAATAQTSLEQVLDFRCKNKPLPEALYELSDRAEVVISFNNSLLPADRTVTVNLRRKSLRFILTAVLDETDLDFILSDTDRILITQKPPPPPPVSRLTLSGYLLDADTGEPLIGAFLQDSLSGQGTFSNAYGFYSLTLSAGNTALKAGYVGYQSARRNLNLRTGQRIDFELQPSLTLAEVIIYASDVSAQAAPAKIGTEEIWLREQAVTPGIGGENDVIKAVHNLTGVQTGADGYGGFTVRGGNVDQNLVLLDGVPVYNSSHALGLYSIFNPSTVSRTKVVKGVFPARYGGRISSVLDVRTKEGNNRRLSGEAEVGLLSASALIEGPIVPEKSSFLVSARRSFLDLYSRPIYRRQLESETSSGELSYFFYDVNGKINHRFNRRDKVYFSFYVGEDRFDDSFAEEIRVNFLPPAPELPDSVATLSVSRNRRWGNVIASGRWNHTFSDKLFANTTLTYTRFYFQNVQPRQQINTIDKQPLDTLFNVRRFNSNNQDIAAKIDFDYHPSATHHLLFGASVTAHRFQPRIIQFEGNIPLDTFTQVVEGRVDRPALNSAEYDAYVEDEWQVNERWRVNPGLRFSVMQSPGRTYYRTQPRFSFTYTAAENFYVQGAAGLMVQPVHLLTTTGQGRAEDLWVSATSRFAPIESRQISLGLEYHPGDFWNLSVEGYLKDMKNIISFQEGLIQNIDAQSWQNVVVSGTGTARGLEFNFRKVSGRFTGGLSYTLASTTRLFAARNQGKPYRHQFDRRNNLNADLHWKAGKKISVFWAFVYQSGSLTSVPQASYLFTQPSLLFPFQGQVPVYSGLSNVELPPYHRMDAGVHFNWAEKPIKHQLKIGIYNFYNRQNPSYYTVSDECSNSDFCYKQVTLVPFLPYLRYQVKF